jgi:hypothetical protein
MLHHSAISLYKKSSLYDTKCDAHGDVEFASLSLMHAPWGVILMMKN